MIVVVYTTQSHALMLHSAVCDQVLSDSNITPLLTMLGAAAQASRRPVWGSTLVFELWEGSRLSELGVCSPLSGSPYLATHLAVLHYHAALNARIQIATIVLYRVEP